MKNKFLCIHGHFYQPPRESPWLEEVEIEDSAFPYHDWNERIAHECYGPNAASPVLGQDGGIARLVDNYRAISFDFGPTLLSWLERRMPRLYSWILEADRLSSAERNGHGNAMAQAYNHVILPLASRRDKTTQVRWGLEDFRHRFGREPEGMWLPETAVDDETLEVLVAQGLRFTVLSPFQAAKVRPAGGTEADWLPANPDDLDTTRPYRWLSKERPGKSIAVFFYHRALSQAVAFERLLDDGGRFASRLIEIFTANDAAQLVNVATDGESYGHHHKFGNMALSFVVDRFPRDTPVRLANYGQFLELFAPPQEVLIRPNTSWSCSHGLGRWSDDCGCRTGAAPGSRQKWRKPLREALDWLAAEIDSVFAGRGKGLFRDPWEARDAYIRRVLDMTQTATAEFLRRECPKSLSDDETKEALRLCEMERCRMLMFTSCGWFFDDISGLESIQILKYACRAIELAEGFGRALAEEFIERLAAAPSNDPEYGSGAAVFKRLVTPLKADLKTAAAHFSLLHHLEGDSGRTPHHGFEVEESNVRRLRKTDGARSLSLSRVELRRPATLESGAFAAAVYSRADADVECRLLPEPPAEHWRGIQDRLAAAFEKEDEEEFGRTLRGVLPAGWAGLGSLFADERRKAAAALLPRGAESRRDFLRAWRADIRRLKADTAHLEAVVGRLHDAVREGFSPDSLPDVEEVRRRLSSELAGLLERPSSPELENFSTTLERLRLIGLRLDLWELQGLYWSSLPRLGRAAPKLALSLNFSHRPHAAAERQGQGIAGQKQ